MKVKALTHINQIVGSLEVLRVLGTVFELNDKDAAKGEEAGLVEVVEPKRPIEPMAKDRKTKVIKVEETK